jgi:hypothetical protein
VKRKRPTHDNRRPALPAPEATPVTAPDVDQLIDVLRDDLRRADAMVSTAERQIEENWHDGDDESDLEEEFDTVLRHRMRIEYLVEAGKLAVRAALYTTERLDAALKRGA